MVKVRFEMDKETKNTYRYKEVADSKEDEVVGSIYIKKSIIDKLEHNNFLDYIEIDIQSVKKL